VKKANSKELPVNWTNAELSGVAEINPPLDRCIVSDDVVVDFVPMRAVEPEGAGILRPEVSNYGEVKKGYTAFMPGDVIMAKITPCMENGKTCVVPILPGAACFGSTEFHVVRPERGVEARWIAHFLLQHSTRHAAQRQMMGGVGQMRVPSAFLGSLKIPVPPASEQQRIVERIDELLSDLDAGVAALERARAKLKHYRAAVLKAAIEGSLTAEWRYQHPATEPAAALLTRILAERRRRWEEAQREKFKAAGKPPPKDWKARYSDPTAPDTAHLPPLAEGWCWVRLEQLLYEIEAGKSFECVPRPAQPDEWGIIKVSAMSWGAFDENENKTVPATRAIDPRYEIRSGDILLSRANTYELVGASVLVNQCRPRLLLSDKSMRLLYNSQVDKLWLKTMLSSPWARGQLSRKSTGTKEGMRNVSQENVLDVVVPLAPADECFALVEAVEEQLSVIEHLEGDLEAKLTSPHYA
jgi:type I restriction enzyme S subunit